MRKPDKKILKNHSKPILYLSAISLLLLTITLGIYTDLFSNNQKRENESEPVSQEEKNLPEDRVNFISVNYPKSVYYAGEPLAVEIEIHNPHRETQNLWLGYSLQGPSGRWIDLAAKEISLPSENTTTFSRSSFEDHLQLESALSGSYVAVFALWDQSPMQEGAKRLTDISVPDAFRYHHGMEVFEAPNDELWYSRKGILGRSSLEPGNVAFQGGRLQITLPKNTLQGGELQSRDTLYYGSYEIRMRIPDAPSSITGFFLYKAPDFYHEIDIEIFNRKDTKILLTTYYQGSIHHEAVLPLDFDPTADFHQYRLDYYPEEVAFYIDDVLIRRWEDGFSQEPMYLFVNTWYPQWLEGTPPHEDKILEVEWIRY